MENKKKVKIVTMVCAAAFTYSLQSTIVVTVSNCRIVSDCSSSSKCQNVCQFGGLNTIGDIVKFSLRADVVEQSVGSVNEVTPVFVQFKTGDWQTKIDYKPTQGHLKEKMVVLLFYHIDLQNEAYIKSLPKKMRENINKYQQQDETIRYAFFMFKKVGKTIWQEISENYLAEKSPDTVSLPITIYPDGNIQVTVPSGDKAGETIFIRIDQMS
jgi:hypothetical protein